LANTYANLRGQRATPLRCYNVTLLNVRDCAPDFAKKALEYRNDFDTAG